MENGKFEGVAFIWLRHGNRFEFTLTGRDAWALSRLITAKEKGVTPVSEPTGPRWSAYIHNLRGMGLDIETISERHGGAFPGTHARYVLHSDVQLLRNGGGCAE